MLMLRLLILYMLLCLPGICAQPAPRYTVVADSASHEVLPNASVFNSQGNFIGISRVNGRLPHATIGEYPLTIRYMGFNEKIVDAPGVDTIFLSQNDMQLSEVVVESRRHKLLHIMAYVREYSTLTTYSDTVFMFREKMVDYMLPADVNVRFRGWRTPRVIASKSYYRFTGSDGRDSVSDRCNQHFSWADWVGIAPAIGLPPSLSDKEVATDTIRGKYSATEIWVKNADRVRVDVNVMADTLSRKWVPNLSSFFHAGVDFEQFRVQFNYDNVLGDKLNPIDMSGYSFNIESNGRGHGMFMFNRIDEPFFVSTYAEVYIIDREYITVKDAHKWQKLRCNDDGIEILEPLNAPPLQHAVQQLIARVNGVDNDRLRQIMSPDKRLAGRHTHLNIYQQALKRVKMMFGLDKVNAQRRWNNQWRTFRQTQHTNNQKKE